MNLTTQTLECTKEFGQWRSSVFWLLTLHLAAFLLLLSWVYPSTQPLWQDLSLQLFSKLNATLNHNTVWDSFWAFANTRACDLLVALLMLAAFIIPRVFFPPKQLRLALMMFLLWLALLLFFRIGLAKWVGFMDLQHNSPSMLVTDFFSLSVHFPQLDAISEIKDRSARSFPGDHASILILWTLFITIFGDRKRALWVVIFALVFLMPRLIGGAHGIDDIAVGSLSVVLITLAWGLNTPWLWRLNLWLYRITAAPLHKLQRWSVFSKLAVLSSDRSI